MKPVLVTILRFAVSAACLWVAIRLMPNGFADRIAEAKPGWIAIILLLAMVAILVMALRLWILAPPMRCSYGAAIVTTWCGQFGTTLGLGFLSADGIRVARLVRGGLGVGTATGLILRDRLFGLGGLALLASYGWAAHLAGLVAGFAVSLMLIMVGTGFAALLGRLRRPPFLASLTELSPWRLAGALGISVLLHGLSIAMFLCAAAALGYHPPVAETLFAVSIGLFFAILPVSLGGWGVRELAIAQGFAVIAHPFPDAVAASVLFGALVLILALPGAVMFFIGQPGQGR